MQPLMRVRRGMGNLSTEVLDQYARGRCPNLYFGSERAPPDEYLAYMDELGGCSGEQPSEYG